VFRPSDWLWWLAVAQKKSRQEANSRILAQSLLPRQIQKPMSRSLFAILAFLAPGLMLSAFSLGEPLHYRLASDPTLKGKGKDGQCMDYAIALSSRLASNGIHGQLIFYRWHIRNTPVEGSHVFVRYHVPDGTEWIVDNEIPHPKVVPTDASPMQLVFLLSDTPSAPVEVQLQDGLNRLSFF
jgi:hypothetical protein